jgi:D-serine deaminase-like pyridoxal phosphate-dependent protein
LNPEYIVTNIDEVDSPAILVYPELVKTNIRLAIEMAGGPERLRPHVKTHKLAEVTQLQMEAGIKKFKCATIAEAEMLAAAGAEDILLAYQPTTVKARRIVKLATAYPNITFGYLLDNEYSAASLQNILNLPNIRPWLDINVGMNRTGIKPFQATELYRFCRRIPALNPAGLHAYDGHIHETDVALRAEQTSAIYNAVMDLKNTLKDAFAEELPVVIGGTPGFPYYATQPDVDTSPGTFVFWDEGYTTMFPDMKFVVAALLLTRVISIIDETTICLDLGHKSVAAESPLPRVLFPDYPDVRVIGQSEEHLVVRVADSTAHKPGDVWFGIPHHICPTVALYDMVYVVEAAKVTASWKVVARDRMITI